MQEEQKGSSCFYVGTEQTTGKGEKKMAKFLSYGDWLEIEGRAEGAYDLYGYRKEARER